ncbi:hypothetical protein INT47_011676 [Mucor saturninus]|uniref:Uncharacterized protein n=1 Tax=Mucor saturninus TaxID=64648 RepID=A0A8H7US84_9FUNG|nr:hypothetical protein INT47_011676 [Mucor saturninus]
MIRTNKKQANFISSDTIKELVVNEAEAAVQTSPHPAHLPPQTCPSPPQETFSNASPTLASASHSSEACISSNNSPQPSVQHQEKQAGKQTNTDANTEE